MLTGLVSKHLALCTAVSPETDSLPKQGPRELFVAAAIRATTLGVRGLAALGEKEEGEQRAEQMISNRQVTCQRGAITLLS